jgi:hypothetical protein
VVDVSASDVDAVDVDSVDFESLSAFDASPAAAELVSDVADDVSDSVGVAHAKPAGAAMAVPMPSATANAPTRPMYLLCPDLVDAMAHRPFSSLLVRTRVRYTANCYLLRRLFGSGKAVGNGSITPGSNLSKFDEVVNTPAQSYEIAVDLMSERT